MRCLTSSAPVCTLEHLWPTANSPPDREANSTVDCQTPQALRASPPFRGAIALPPASSPSALGPWPSILEYMENLRTPGLFVPVSGGLVQ